MPKDVIIIPSSSFLTFISGSDSGSFTFDNNQLVYNAQGTLILSSTLDLPNLNQTSSAIKYLVLDGNTVAFTTSSGGGTSDTSSYAIFAETSSYGFIGTPTDGIYSDGFFDYFTPDTSVADAVDDISEAFSLLIPPQPGVLTSNTLTKSSPTTFTGKISDGLSPEWYVGTSAGSSTIQLTAATSVVLTSPNASTSFRAGKAADISASLSGGVSASIQIGEGSLIVEDSRSLSSGLGYGDNNNIQITSIVSTSSFWAKANASISDTITQTGSIKYVMSADNGAGQSNQYQLFYVGTVTDFPVASFLSGPATSSVTEVLKYLSGIAYYGNGTQVQIQFSAQNLYKPVYYSTLSGEATLESSYFTNVNVGTGSVPYTDSILYVTQSRTITSNIQTTYNAIGTYTSRLRKPNKSDVTSVKNLGVRAINTYGTTGTALIEYFDDETYRYSHFTQSVWDSSASLNDGELQVQNGRLIEGRFGEYSIFTTIGQIYYRVFTPTNGNVAGTFTIAKNGFTPGITRWNGTGSLQVAFYIASESGSNVYDMGRSVGDNFGNIYGVRDSVAGNVTNWGIPNPPNTFVSSTDPMILAIRFSGSSASDYLTQLTMTFNNG